MNEAETRADHIDPALAAAGWSVVEGSRIRREYPMVSRAIRDAVAAGKIKLAAPEQTSLRYRSYVPFWA